jgi:RsiW-degrading membrane proteinase PrsW (M82 family)
VLLPKLLGESDTLTFGGGIVVGFIEEACKLAAVVIIARRIPHSGTLDGLVLGTAVGMGFAALESTGYAFTILVASGGDVIASLEETVIRAVIAPFGHGIWTGIAAAALFHASDHRWRVTPIVVVAFAFVVLLHGAWDGLHVGGVVTVFGFPIAVSLIVVALVGIVVYAAVYRVALAAQPPPGTAVQPATVGKA